MKITLATIAIAALVALAGAPASKAAEWNLQPITAHAPNVWKAAPNWTYDAGNPLNDNGAKWTLSVQLDKDPTLTSTYTPLDKATAWTYFYVWGAGGADLPYMYRDFILSSKAKDTTPQASPATVLRFQPPSAGTYQVDIAGTIKVQNESAGNARATIYVLAADGSTATQLAVVDLNNASPSAFGHYPDKLNYHAAIPLKKDEEVAVRIQTINPGPASAGSSSLTFDQFKVTGP